MELKTNLLKIYTLTMADIKGRYRNTFAGLLWVMFNPILQFMVHSLVFKYILNLQIQRYFVFLLAGLLPWIFMTTAISQTAHSFITKRDVLMSFQLSPLTLLFSKLADNFLNFLIPFFCLLLFTVTRESISLEGLWFLPLNLTLMLLMTMALNVLVSTLQVFFRDIQYIVQFIFSVLYFLTPIFYPETMMPERFRFLLELNPFYAVIKPFQRSLWNYDPEGLFNALLWAAGYTSIMLVAAIILWKKKKNELYLYI